MEVRNTRASRTSFLSILTFVVLGLLVLGFVFFIIANSQLYIPGGPDTPVGEFFWTGFLVLIGIGIIGVICTVVIAIVIAVRTARANANLRRLREQLISARKEERRRLRRDLHDGLGPLLASLTLTLTASRKLLRDDPDAAEILLADATTHAQVEVACYRIAQEALTNVVRHTQAHTCMVHIIGEMFTLEITDDGVGLSATYKSGVGLNSMRERAEELGGTCAIVPVSGGGTRVYAQIPLS